MSKRSRGSARSTHRRPGSRPPTTRSARPPRTVRPASELEAAPIIAEDVVEGQATDEQPAAAERRTERIERSTMQRTRAKAGSLLAARAATEYLYVAQDLRRILVLSAVLFGALALIWLLIVVLRILPLDFY